MKNIEENKTFPAILIGGAIFLAITSIIISSIRELSSLENTLLQIFTLFLGLAGSFIFGRQSAKDAARDVIKPHARSAFRRVLSLYGSLSRLGSSIDSARTACIHDDVILIYDKLEAIVTEQIVTADDAIADWRDIVPEDVQEILNAVEREQKFEWEQPDE